jgi:hypothetical protein
VTYTGERSHQAAQFVELSRKCHTAGVKISVSQAFNTTKLDNVSAQDGLRRLVSVEPATATTI